MWRAYLREFSSKDNKIRLILQWIYVAKTPCKYRKNLFHIAWDLFPTQKIIHFSVGWSHFVSDKLWQMIFEFFLWWKLWYHLHTTFFEGWLALGFDKVFPRPNQLCHCIVSKYQLHSMLLHLVLLKAILLPTFRPVLFDFRQNLKPEVGFFPWNRPFFGTKWWESYPNRLRMYFYYSGQSLVPKIVGSKTKKSNFRFRGSGQKSKSTPCISVQSSRRRSIHIKTACDDHVKGDFKP